MEVQDIWRLHAALGDRLCGDRLCGDSGGDGGGDGDSSMQGCGGDGGGGPGGGRIAMSCIFEPFNFFDFP